MKKPISILLLLALSFSCSINNSVSNNKLIQKKKYSKGFTVFNKARFKPSENNLNEISVKSDEITTAQIANSKLKNNKIEIVYPNIINQPKEARLSNYRSLNDVKKYRIARKTIQKTLECDLIFLKTGDEILAKVLKVSDNEIEYKQCDSPDGPTFTKATSTIFKIKYSNGTETVFSNNSNTANNNINQDPLISNNGGKSQLLAAILCLFIGVLGIHRFYLGYTGIAIIQLLTLGLCGIWTLIDLIMILTGSLKPRQGDYEDKL